MKMCFKGQYAYNFNENDEDAFLFHRNDCYLKVVNYNECIINSMRILIIVIIMLQCHFSGKAQVSCGGGTFPIYKELKIQKIEEFSFEFYFPGSWRDSIRPAYEKKINDSIPVRTLYFNQKGQMVMEEFTNRHNAYYKYSYNNGGFLIDIDTNGRFDYGFGYSDGYKDTLWENINKEEQWFSINTIKKLKTETICYSNDSICAKTIYEYDTTGRLIKEIYFDRKNLDDYHLTGSVLYEYIYENLLSKIIYKDEENRIYRVEKTRYFFYED